MITNYQIKKYGYYLCPSYYTPKITKEDIKRITNNANHRERNRKRKKIEDKFGGYYANFTN